MPLNQSGTETSNLSGLDQRRARARRSRRPGSASIAGRWQRVVVGEVEQLGVDHARIHDVHLRRRCRADRPSCTRPTPRSPPWSRRTRLRAGGDSRAATDDTNTMPAGALDDPGQQREREAHRREVVDRASPLRRSSASSTVHGLALRDARRCSRARRCRRARRTPARRTRRAPSRSARSIVHARESGACSRHRASTASSLSVRRAQMPTVAPRSANPRERGADARRRAGHEHVLAVQVVRHDA